jgi:hypothetical protein
VTRWKGFERIVDLVLITGADRTVIHDLSEAVASFLRCDGGDVGLADGEEVRTETTDQPFEENLEDGSGDERVEESDDCIVGIPERANADLADENDDDGDESAEKCSEPDGDDLFAYWVCELRVYDFTVLEVDGEGA